MALRDRARALRADATDAERHLWSHLRRQTLRARFPRQVPLGPYIVDFACFDLKLVIEVDGGQHVEQEEADRVRDAWLEENGYRVLRLWNDDVMQNIDGVIDVITGLLETAPLPSPPPRRGRG